MRVKTKTVKESVNDEFAEWLRNRNKMNSTLVDKLSLVAFDFEETSFNRDEALYLLALLEDDGNAIGYVSDHLEIDL